MVLALAGVREAPVPDDGNVYRLLHLSFMFHGAGYGSLEQIAVLDHVVG